MATSTHPSAHSRPGQANTDVASSLKDTAAAIGSDMKEEARNRAEEARGATSESLRSFAEAVRHAGDELAGKDQGHASQLLAQAANGLEQISNAIGQKRLEDIVGDVRRFGRQHPGTFMLGSMLMGVALGRLARSAAPDTGHEAPAEQPDGFDPLSGGGTQTAGGSDVL